MSFSWHSANIKECASSKDQDLSNLFLEVIKDLKLRNIFNPSFYVDETLKIFAFRAIIEGTDELESFISIEDYAGRKVKQLSTQLRKDFDAPKFIDPKVIKLANQYFVTFNSGWIPEGNNVYIMKIYPEMGPPKCLIYKNRQIQERNWAFFTIEKEVYALYWMNPLKILKLKVISDLYWEMEDYYAPEVQDNDLPNDLTIGTQLFGENGCFYFISHQKRYFQSKKVYLGKFCTFYFDSKKIVPGEFWLSHSLESILGSDIKHNSNLYSCTYFSGLQVIDNLVKLGYGINDIEFGFSSHKLNTL